MFHAPCDTDEFHNIVFLHWYLVKWYFTEKVHLDGDATSLILTFDTLWEYCMVSMHILSISIDTHLNQRSTCVHLDFIIFDGIIMEYFETEI